MLPQAPYVDTCECADVELEHIYSYIGSSSKQNLLYLHDGSLLFNSGTICVVHDLQSDKQKFFRQHTEFVSAFALFPFQAQNIVASSQVGSDARICIWNTASMKLIGMLQGSSSEESPQQDSARVFPLFLEAGVRDVSFSKEGKRLVALGDDAACSLVIHECASKTDESKWTRSRFIASTRVQPAG